MRLVVYPHDLAIGGSQINAIDMAAAVRDAGHDVIVYGLRGPLEEYVAGRGLEFVPARPLRYRPAPSRIVQLRQLARHRRIDLIHAYEWPPCQDAYFGAHLIDRVPVVCTVLSMSVMDLVPRHVPLVMGTEALSAEARGTHRGPVWTLEPPIDTVGDHPGLDGDPFRRAHDVGDDDELLVTVSRLAIDLKLDALMQAIDAADVLARERRIRLVMVGGGEAHDQLAARAQAVNERHGRTVVTLPGPSLDPRSAYAAADVVVGMGSSSLRAMAVGRATVVQGERGFSEIMEPVTEALFLRQGFWGIGDGEPHADRLADQIRSLLDDPRRREELGRFGRRLVADRFSLERATGLILDIYAAVLSAPVRRHAADVLDAGWRAARLEVEMHDPRRKRERHRHRHARLEHARHGG